MVPSARLPQRADRAAAGTLPTRAFRFCEAMTTASSFGWYIFPPIGFKLMWDGSDVIWTYDGVEDWFPLTTAQFPNFAPHFDDAAPDDIKGYSPPFLSSFIEPGVLQIWSPQQLYRTRRVADLERPYNADGTWLGRVDSCASQFRA